MGQRSFLYPGRDVEHLTPAERQLERLYDQIDRPGYRITPSQFFQTPEAAQLLDQLYGGLTDRIPPGSQIVSETPGKVTYRDPEGYEHNVIRKPDGQFTETTNRPSITPNKGQQDFLAQLQSRLQQSLGPLGLAELPPEVSAQLQAMSDAEKARIAQQGEDERGKLVAQLYGNRVNQSSIANDAAARFAQMLGLVQQQQSSDAAARSLGLRQYLTSAGLQQNQDLAGLLANLSGQQNQRDIAGAGLTLDRQRLDEAARQFNLGNYNDILRTQTEQERLDAENSGFNKFIKTLNAAAGLLQGGGTAYGAYKRG